jgi:omega-amidase
MRVYCCQYAMEWENPPGNWGKVAGLLAGEAGETLEPGSLVVLPELFDTGFSMRAPELARSYPGQAESFLRELAISRAVYVLAGVAVQSAKGRGGNQAVVFSTKGELLARYTKTFPFTPGGEHAVFDGGAGPVLFAWEDCLVAPFVCYDLRFPEIQRLAVRRGAELLVFVASWPSTRAAHWLKLLQARAIENQCYVVGVNRVGTDPFHSYSGNSIVVNPFGEIVADALGEEGVLGCNLDLAGLREYRQKLPFLRDIRPEFLAHEGA